MIQQRPPVIYHCYFNFLRSNFTAFPVKSQPPVRISTAVTEAVCMQQQLKPGSVSLIHPRASTKNAMLQHLKLKLEPDADHHKDPDLPNTPKHTSTLGGRALNSGVPSSAPPPPPSSFAHTSLRVHNSIALVNNDEPTELKPVFFLFLFLSDVPVHTLRIDCKCMLPTLVPVCRLGLVAFALR
jgi:hypothetical protein